MNLNYNRMSTFRFTQLPCFVSLSVLTLSNISFEMQNIFPCQLPSTERWSLGESGTCCRLQVRCISLHAVQVQFQAAPVSEAEL